MASKLQIITEYAQKLTVGLAEQRGVWQNYLLTAARVYKYPFPEQLLIYGQRPDATACAPIELWNNRMGRWVNRGAKGIALIDDSGERPRLKYVFDVSDTHPGNYRSLTPRLWRMGTQYQDAAAEALGNAFGSPEGEALSFADHMNAITSEVETIDHPDSDPDDDVDDSWTEQNLHITITAKTAEEMKTEYNFTEKQKKVLDELLENRAALLELIGDLQFISADAEEVLQNLPDDLPEERRKVIKTACSLVGKVAYFWGGKSLVIGWDGRWGTIQKVWAEGSSTTGTYRPYGLDCSGFVDWVFYNVSDGAYVIGHGGGATMQHSYCTPISWADAIPGDLVFYPDDMHVGIVGGWDADGNLLIIHCASSANGTVVSGVSGFTSIGRPLYYAE